MKNLTLDPRGTLILEGRPLPGQITSLSVGGKMVIDTAQAEGGSGRQKNFSGYDDSRISITLVLLEPEEGGQSRFDHLATLNRAFKRLEGGGPRLYNIGGGLLDSFDIRYALLLELSADQDNSGDSITVTLKLEEHDPLVGIIQKQPAPAAKGETSPTPPGPPEGVSEAEYQDFQTLREAGS